MRLNCKDNNLYKSSKDKSGALVGRKYYEASSLVLYFARPGGESQVLPRPQGRWREEGGGKGYLSIDWC